MSASLSCEARPRARLSPRAEPGRVIVPDHAGHPTDERGQEDELLRFHSFLTILQAWSQESRTSLDSVTSRSTLTTYKEHS